ncbi:bifunctional FCP1 homology domain/BRCT domain superfamily/CTD phosphatase Fcp1/HAD superfamily/HAD-like superfamily [Babesia duncani]|uniref:protein-serine/threonine phosphatase n=1 Tax=Babesia duncani TaxID=323732 RepID=A0AAD9UNA1_9APIC|nr:bifunctional FCP1 homology domain/BRCT domain superfamily/CTD phosphatase Fcp1/HAD superfamily/HAD-like superfamily [Babesia duncani]
MEQESSLVENSGDLEDWLGSELEEEFLFLTIPDDVKTPVKLQWVVNDNAHVVQGQLLAILSNVAQDSEKQTSSCCIKSPAVGKLLRLMDNFSIIDSAEVVVGKIEVIECAHEVIVHNLCVGCFKHIDNPTNNKRKGPVDQSIIQSDKRQRAGFISNDDGLLVDESLIKEMEYGEVLRLLKFKKLCLVLDLDNTLIHASPLKPPVDVDIEIMDLVNDQSILNMGAQYTSDDVKLLEIQKRLEHSILATTVANESTGKVCPSYFKLRPGIFNFMQEASKCCELYLFTMGTKSHAMSALAIIDPKGIYFGKRIFSRSDASANLKSLDCIFPNTKNLVLIMDDSEHAWTSIVHLIKVHPYFYFVDSSCIANRDPRALSRISASLQCPCIYSNFYWSNVQEQTVTTRDGFVLPKPIGTSKPYYNHLLVATTRPEGVVKTQDGKIDMIQAQDHDVQLQYMTKLIQEIHKSFFNQFDDLVSNECSNEDLNLQLVKGFIKNNSLPSTGYILESLRSQVLSGCCLYAHVPDFKNLLDLDNVNLLYHSDFGYWACRFGAKFTFTLNQDVTHVLYNNANSKLDNPQVKAVHIKWLEACIYTWTKMDETHFDPNVWKKPHRTFWELVPPIPKPVS